MHRRVLILGAATVAFFGWSARGWAEDKFRIGQGGFWDEGVMWSPPGVPETGDDCFHQEQATDILTFDGYGDGGIPRSLTVTAGGSPQRGFLVGSDESFSVTETFTKTGAGTYAVTVGSYGLFHSGYGISGGDWTVESDADVLNLGPGGIDLQDDTWTIGPGAAVVQEDASAGIVGDLFFSRLTLEGDGSLLYSAREIDVAYMTANAGSTVSASWLVPERELRAFAAQISAQTVRVDDYLGERYPLLRLNDGTTLDAGYVRIGDHATLRYGGQATNVLDAGSLRIEYSGLLQKEPNGGDSELNAAFQVYYSVLTTADYFSGWDASGVRLECVGNAAGYDSPLEVTYGDFGGLFFVDVACVPYGGLIVRTAAPGNPPTSLMLVDY